DNQKLRFNLNQNYPNPFNPTTQIDYSITKAGLVTLKVYDILGNEVAILVNERREPGYYLTTFDAANLPSGIYIYRIVSGNFQASKKMILLK
ncbi:MAG: T9SS type A sorting domain-containing protein, partial [Bacteroidetes bacterium]|nr:T9SS type A sorting domain-containing protein [Bacteroidota bacterium]